MNRPVLHRYKGSLFFQCFQMRIDFSAVAKDNQSSGLSLLFCGFGNVSGRTEHEDCQRENIWIGMWEDCYIKSSKLDFYRNSLAVQIRTTKMVLSCRLKSLGARLRVVKTKTRKKRARFHLFGLSTWCVAYMVWLYLFFSLSFPLSIFLSLSLILAHSFSLALAIAPS